MRLERVELYRRVWETPLRTLAREYGISDVALKKHCRKLDVPTPGLGYWAKVEAGQLPRRQALPKLRADVPSFTEIVGGRAVEPKSPLGEGPVWEQQQAEAEEGNRIVVGNDLEGAPRTVRHTRAALRQARPGERGIVRPQGEGCLDVAVARESVDRALRILHAFLTACVTRDVAVTVSKDGTPATTVTVRGESLAIRMEEQTRREERKPAPSSRRSPAYSLPLYPRFEYVPTGRLCLRIDERYLPDVRCSWADGARQRVEDCLNSVMVGLVAAAEAKRVAREAAEARRREWEARERYRAEQERQRELERRRRKQLHEDCDAWHVAKRLREFADAAERTVVLAPDPERLTSWLEWVRTYANDLDPLMVEDASAHLMREPDSVLGLVRDRGWPDR